MPLRGARGRSRPAAISRGGPRGRRGHALRGEPRRGRLGGKTEGRAELAGLWTGCRGGRGPPRLCCAELPPRTDVAIWTRRSRWRGHGHGGRGARRRRRALPGIRESRRGPHGPSSTSKARRTRTGSYCGSAGARRCLAQSLALNRAAIALDRPGRLDEARSYCSRPRGGQRRARLSGLLAHDRPACGRRAGARRVRRGRVARAPGGLDGAALGLVWGPRSRSRRWRRPVRCGSPGRGARRRGAARTAGLLGARDPRCRRPWRPC